MFNIRKISFTLHHANGTKQEIVKVVLGDNDEVAWVARQYADVNNCGVLATYEGKTITTVGSIQST